MLSPVTARSVHPTCVKTVRVGSQKSVDQTHRKAGLFVAENRFFSFHEEDCGPLWEWEKRAALRKEWLAARIDVPEQVQSSKQRTDAEEGDSHPPYGTRTLTITIAAPGTEQTQMIRMGNLLYSITRARTAHLVTNLVLSVVQYTRSSCVTSGSSNIATSANADRAMSSRALAHIAKENTLSLEQTLTGWLAHRQGSVRGSSFCPVFSEEVLHRNQVDAR